MAFRTWTIRRRLTAVILAITLAALGIGFSIVGLQQLRTLRHDRLATTTLIANVVGTYSATSVTFADVESAREDLARLDAYPEIAAAALYDDQGKLFATWSRGGLFSAWLRDAAGHWPIGVDIRQRLQQDNGSLIEIRLPIIDADGRIDGAIHLRARTDTPAAVRSQRRYLFTMAATAIALLVFSALGAQLLGRLISKPIVQLTKVAEEIAADRDVSVKVPEAGGGELAALTSAFDVMLTRLAARDRALRLSVGTLRAVIDASPLGIIGVDPRRQVTLWNQGAVRLFGVPEGDAVGRLIYDVVPAPPLRALWQQSTSPTGVAGAEVRLPRGESALELICSSAPLRAPDGEVLGAVIVVADDTERKLSALALQERASQLQRAQKMEVVGRLAGGVAHDFNNLLTVVMTSCQLLARRVDERAHVHVRNILDAAERGSALARRLLAFSKQQALDRRVIDLRMVVNELERMLRTVLGEHTTLRLDLEEIPAGVEIDQGQLEQVLLNLALNARDAMPKGGELSVSTRIHSGVSAAGSGAPARLASGEWVALSVSDTGIGMAPDTVARVFEPFFTTKEHGTGLGLATALAIVRDAGGDMTVDSAPGKGTTFTLWLPMAPGHVEEDSSSRDAPLPPGRETILLVEDEPAVRAVAREILQDAGYVVIEAVDGVDGLDRARASANIDLVVTDVVMPRMSGPQLAEALATLRPGLQVLYMSGYVGDALAPLGVEDGPGRALLHKPFTAEVLLLRVREIIDNRPPTRTRRPSTVHPYSSITPR